jgi:hypothetical protein
MAHLAMVEGGGNSFTDVLPGLGGYQVGYLVAGGLALLAAVVALGTPGHVGRPGLTTPAERVRMDT